MTVEPFEWVTQDFIVNPKTTTPNNIQQYAHH
jgi:hypothetical protein